MPPQYLPALFLSTHDLKLCDSEKLIKIYYSFSWTINTIGIPFWIKGERIICLHMSCLVVMIVVFCF